MTAFFAYHIFYFILCYNIAALWNYGTSFVQQNWNRHSALPDVAIQTFDDAIHRIEMNAIKEIMEPISI